MDTALLFAGIVALTVLGVVLFGLIGLLERLVLPRHAVERASFSGHRSDRKQVRD
jgi:ABC-type nitrate/sulfonate/bicarbonate transport system permease component